MPRKNAFYAQSGGVTAVINASACGVIETARANRDKIGKVFAGRNGIIGALREELYGRHCAPMARANWPPRRTSWGCARWISPTTRSETAA